MSTDVTVSEAALLQERLMAFVRAFGLHKGDETPCGAPVPVSEAHALAALARAGADGLAQDELARQLALTKSTVSRLVDQLVERRWAERRSDANDGRRRTVVLTDDGQATAAAIARRRSERMALLLERVPEDRRSAVLAALEVLVEAAGA
jgi:DNA-binding MarR family transcriptional regulator